MSGYLEFEDVSFTYPDGTRALNGVSFSIERGQTVGIIGANGAGKSTLAQLIVGVLLPTAGKVTVGGLELNRNNINEIRRTAGLVFQNPDDQLFMPTILDDIAFGLLNSGVSPEIAAEKARAAAARMWLRGLENKFPGHLSVGQRKAAAIAATIVGEPEILICDEPAASLDPKSRRTLINLLAGLNITKLIISHDLELILDLCPRLIMLDGGKLVSDGEPMKILADRDLVEAHHLEVPPSLDRSHKHRFQFINHHHD
jgi:cobalt/nickel transport system ATP-binding protein